MSCPRVEDKEGGSDLLSHWLAAHIQEAPTAQGLSFTQNTTEVVSLGAVQIAPYPDPFPIFNSVLKKKKRKEKSNLRCPSIHDLFIDPSNIC